MSSFEKLLNEAKERHRPRRVAEAEAAREAKEKGEQDRINREIAEASCLREVTAHLRQLMPEAQRAFEVLQAIGPEAAETHGGSRLWAEELDYGTSAFRRCLAGWSFYADRARFFIRWNGDVAVRLDQYPNYERHRGNREMSLSEFTNVGVHHIRYTSHHGDEDSPASVSIEDVRADVAMAALIAAIADYIGEVRCLD
jgi:hypothetical protein